MKIVSLAFLSVTAILFFLQSKPLQNSATEQTSILSPTKPLSPLKSAETLSVDGRMKLIMKSQEKLDGSTIYSFFVSESSGKENKLLFSKTISKGSMELPRNAWSPDDKFVFILDKEPGDNYLVFKANGDLFANGQKFLDATALFKEKEPSFSLSEMTGWDGVGLMHVKATNGAKFWFDIDSQNFLQLAR